MMPSTPFDVPAGRLTSFRVVSRREIQRLASLWLVLLALVVCIIGHSMMFGPQVALYSELFPTEVRYSGASLGYQVGTVNR